MTNAQLADLLEEAARRLRAAEGIEPTGRRRRTPVPAKTYNTAELAAETGVCVHTIRRMAHRQEIACTPVGGSAGFIFPAGAPESVRELLRMQHSERTQMRRKNASKLRRLLAQRNEP
jgi:hypothetical protein